MLIVLLIVSIIGAIFLFLYIQQRSEVNSLEDQLQYMDKEESTFTLFTNSSDPKIQSIFDSINLIKSEMQKEKSLHLKNEKQIRAMIANISHDIRTPLTSIQGYVEMMQLSEDRKERERYYQIIVHRLDDLQSMLDEFFLYTKLMNTSESYELKSMEVYPIVCHVVLNYMDLLKEQGLSCEMICKDENLMLEIHEESFHRVCMNLLINTLRYGSDPFQITIRKNKSCGEIIFENGLDSTVKIDTENMFERFYKGDNARTQKGSGLGLAIVKELVERMNGEVKAEVENDTLRIIVSLPIQ